jgi:AcrR family transcriptional regulator
MSFVPTASTSSIPPARRTQQERRASTRAALHEATITCLVELGYSGTTTLEVERRAGVSRGARIHHFATKALLLASAVDHLYAHLGDHYEQAFGAGAGLTEAERVGRGLRLMWQVYREPRYLAVVELSVAARTDAELHARLYEVGERHRQLAIEAAGKFFPVLAGEPAARMVDMINSALLGLLVQRNVNADPARAEAVLGLLEAIALQQLHALHAAKRR